MSEEMNMTPSAETAEVAEQSLETGAEEQAFANPASVDDISPEENLDEGNNGENHDDSAWAQMRRESQQYKAQYEASQRELAELKAKNSLFSELAGNEDWEVAAISEQTGLPESEVRLRYELEQEKRRVEQLESEKSESEVAAIMASDLRTIQGIDPSIKDLDELGDDFARYIQSGLDCESAYWAVKAKENANKPKPPTVTAGAVKGGTADEDVLTEAKIAAMSPEERTKNYKGILDFWERKNRA